MRKLPNRWLIACAGLLMQLCLGVLYAWTVFRLPLESLYGWPPSVSIAPYRYSLLCLPLAMIFGGEWQDRRGPRVVASVGGVLLSAGCLLAGLIGHSPWGLILSYGVVAGTGVGFAYVTPIATGLKWFPDRRGFITGLSVMGFGMGSLLFAPLVDTLIGESPARFAVTIPRTFFILAAVFAVVVLNAAQVLRNPPENWRPAGWNPPPDAAANLAHNSSPRQMLRTWQAYALWLIFFLGCAIGQTMIGEAAPYLKAVAAEHGAALPVGFAVGLMAVCNGVGRLTLGAFSDRFGRRSAGVAIFALAAAACFFLLRHATSSPQALAGLCLVGFAFGGLLALMPALTADYYGTAHVGINYGIISTAYGLCGFFVPRLFAQWMDAARSSSNALAGYDSISFVLAVLALAGISLVLTLRRP